MEEEYHPYMKTFTIATLVAGILIGLVSCSAFSNSGSEALLGILLAGLMIGGSIWLLNTSDNFKRWSTLSGFEQFLGYIIMIVGVYIGIAFIVVLAALKVELFRRD